MIESEESIDCYKLSQMLLMEDYLHQIFYFYTRKSETMNNLVTFIVFHNGPYHCIFTGVLFLHLI